jgi:hypothetical protein
MKLNIFLTVYLYLLIINDIKFLTEHTSTVTRLLGLSVALQLKPGNLATVDISAKSTLAILN